MFESEDNRSGQNEWTAPVFLYALACGARKKQLFIMEDIIANLRLR